MVHRFIVSPRVEPAEERLALRILGTAGGATWSVSVGSLLPVLGCRQRYAEHQVSCLLSSTEVGALIVRQIREGYEGRRDNSLTRRGHWVRIRAGRSSVGRAQVSPFCRLFEDFQLLVTPEVTNAIRIQLPIFATKQKRDSPIIKVRTL